MDQAAGRWRTGATAWAAAVALWLPLLWQPKWWHPDCALRGDGPIAWLEGFPLPFAEPSTVTSLEWFIAPVPLAINLFLIGAAVLPLALMPLRRLDRWSPFAAKALSAAGFAAAALVIALWMLFIAMGAFRPTAGFSDYSGRLRPWNTMPAVLAEALGKQACTW